MILTRILLLAGAMALATTTSPAAAQAGLLQRIKSGEPLSMAHRDASIPFSYIDKASGKPVGYKPLEASALRSSLEQLLTTEER